MTVSIDGSTGIISGGAVIATGSTNPVNLSDVAASAANAAIPLPVSPLSGGTGRTPLQLPHWRVAVGKVQSATKNARVLCVGDSTFFGANASGVVAPQNLTYWLSVLLNKAGIPANQNSFCGFGTGTGYGNRLTSDPQGRVAAGSFGSAGPSLPTLGGCVAQTLSGSAPLVFSPGVLVDTFNVLFDTYPAASGSTASLTATGGTPVSVNSYASATLPLFVTATSPSASPSNSLSILYTGGGSYSGGQFNVLGIEAFNSAIKSVNIFNCGWWAAQSGQLSGTSVAAQGFGPLPTLEYIAPDLTIITADINDWQNNVSVSTHTANLQALITAAQTSGDVILVTGIPNNNDPTQQAQIVAATIALGKANNVPVVDMNSRWVSYNFSSALGLYSDTIHPANGFGHYDYAAAIVSPLVNV